MDELHTVAAHSQKYGLLAFLAIFWHTVVHIFATFVTSNMAKYNMPVINTCSFGSTDAEWGGMFVLGAAVAPETIAGPHASQQSSVYEISPQLNLPTILWQFGLRNNSVKKAPPLIVSLLTSVQNIKISCCLQNLSLICKCLNVTVAHYHQTCQRQCQGWAW